MRPPGHQDGARRSPTRGSGAPGLPPDRTSRPPASVHARLVAALRDQLTPPALIIDAWALGAEDVVLSLEIGEDRERRDLHLLLLAPVPLFWLEPFARRHPGPPAGFGLWLRRRAYGAQIVGVGAGRSGRILRLDLATKLGEETPPRALILDPLPNACRLLVLDAEGVVQQRYPPTIHGSPSGRGMPGEAYRESSARPSEFWERQELHAKAGPMERAHPGPEVGPPEKGTRAAQMPRPLSLSPAEGAAQASPEGLWLCTECLPAPTAGEPGRAVVFLSPHPCAAAEATAGPGPVATSPTPSSLPPLEAAHRAGELWRRLARHRLYARQLRQLLQRERRHLDRLGKRLQRECSEAAAGADLRRQAEALLASGGRIPKGAQRAVLDDPSDPGSQIEIQLDRTLSFSQNADRLFRRAGRLERALPIRRKKRDQVETLRRQMSAWLVGSELTDPGYPLRREEPSRHRRPLPSDARGAAPRGGAQTAYEEARAQSKGLDPALRRRWQVLLHAWETLARELQTPIDYIGYEARKHGAPTQSASHGAAGARRPGGAAGASSAAPGGERRVLGAVAGIYPRRFELPGGWIVLVGRSNKENDILTHRVARPTDLWLHARGVAGSHVVLKREPHRDKPPKAIIEQAARIAAYYSKGRTSGMVPVIYTEKRYVRKPRRATPGLAVCMREKVLLVEPRLPEKG